MINYENIVADNFFTEGFELSLPSPMSIAITEGIFAHHKTTENSVITYPAIELDIEGDEELPTQYDIYLLEPTGTEEPNVYVTRTELGPSSIAFYDGEVPLVHLLMTFVVPPGTNDLNLLTLNVRNVLLEPQEEEATTDETTTEE